MRWFSALMPRETRFFALFNRHGALVAEGGRAVAEMVRDYADEEKRRRLVGHIGELERSADKVTHETVSLLHTTFITPFDRDDIHRLISTMDDILDLIQDAAESAQLYDIQSMPPDASRLADLLEACCQHVCEAVELLSSMDNAQRALTLAQKIDGLESDADAVMRSGVSRLFREEQDVRQLIKHKNVFEFLESATDKCQDVANVIESVIVENV
jgi:predicted phosphate transport protein (TIGR00153 family)